MVIDWANLISGLMGGGLVLSLSAYILSRLIDQVDKLADKVDMIHIELAKTTTRLDAAERTGEQSQELKERVVRVESRLKLNGH